MTLNLKTKSVSIGVVLLLVGLLAAAWYWNDPKRAPSDHLATTNHGRGATKDGGVADQAGGGPADSAQLEQEVCRQCHADIVASYQRSGMSRTWRAVGAPGAPDLPTAAARVEDLVSGYSYHVSVGDQGMEQVETRQDTPSHRLRRQADYLVGSGKHATAAVSDHDGYLTQLPAAWFRHDQRWRMNPGFELHNHRFDRPITPGCVSCHSTTAVHEPPTPNRFVGPIAAGIECRRCHGSAEQHVAHWSAEPSKQARRPQPDPGLEPSEQGNAGASLASVFALTSSQANDLCLQCHLQGDATVYTAGSGPLRFRPGDRLRDQRHDFLVESDVPSAVGIASHGARMLQSRCYLASDGAMTCILCHDPHRPAADFDAAHYERKCATCHQADGCGRPDAPSPARDSGCLTCHMPRRSSQEGIHLVLTEHKIVRHQPSPDETAPARSVLPPNAATARLISAWPQDEPTDAILGAAYVQLHETMGPQLPALKRAVELLSNEIRQNPFSEESRFWLGSALAALGRGNEAAPLLQTVVKAQPARHPARFRLAVAYELSGDQAAASEHYRQLIDQVPNWVEPYGRLAQLYIARQSPDQAATLLRQRVARQPDALALAQLSLVERMGGASHESALARVEQALRLDPRLTAAYVHRAALFLLVDQPARARADFQRVLQLDPHHPQAQQALETLDKEGSR